MKVWPDIFYIIHESMTLRLTLKNSLEILKYAGYDIFADFFYLLEENIPFKV